jgi:hypothetical protein
MSLKSILLSQSDGQSLKIQTVEIDKNFIVESMSNLLNAYFGANLPIVLTYEETNRLYDLLHHAVSNVSETFYDIPEVTKPEQVKVEWKPMPQPEPKISFAQWLKIRRAELGLTQRAASEMIDISHVYYVKLELGAYKYPSRIVIKKIETSAFGLIPPNVELFLKD